MSYYEDYAFKVTATGRDLLAALLATGKGLEITRVKVGRGRLDAETDLADMTDLVEYVADGAIAESRHDGDNFDLTVQYASNMTPDIPMFYLSEFAVEAKHPVTGESVNLLYATLGKYIQPVRAYSDVLAPDIRNFPLTIVVSSEIEVTVSSAAGLVTYDDLNEAVKEATKDVGGIVKTIYFSIAPEDWSDSGEGKYPIYADITDEAIKSTHVPEVVFDENSLDVAADARMCKAQNSYNGYVRLKAKAVPASDVGGVLYLIGKATGGGGGGGSDYELSPATRTTLGGMKVGDGLDHKADGTVFLDKASVQETAQEAAQEAVTGEVTQKVKEEAIATNPEFEEMLKEVYGSGTTSDSGKPIEADGDAVDDDF